MTPSDETKWVLIEFEQFWESADMKVIPLEGVTTREEAVKAVHELWRKEHPADKNEAPVNSWYDGYVLLVQWDGASLPFDQWEEAATAEHATWLEAHNEEKTKRKLARLKREYEELKAEVEGK